MSANLLFYAKTGHAINNSRRITLLLSTRTEEQALLPRQNLVSHFIQQLLSFVLFQQVHPTQSIYKDEQQLLRSIATIILLRSLDILRNNHQELDYQPTG